MTPKDLTHYIHTQIPITQTMAFTILSATNKNVQLHVPISPNKNDKQTAFAGSISSALTLAGWIYLHYLLKTHHQENPIAIKTGTTQYKYPIKSDFIVTAYPTDNKPWSPQKTHLHTMTSNANPTNKKTPAATFQGEYVIL